MSVQLLLHTLLQDSMMFSHSMLGINSNAAFSDRQHLPLQSLWHSFVHRNEGFVHSYIAYYHFRSKVRYLYLLLCPSVNALHHA